jgi:hypothetical protein
LCFTGDVMQSVHLLAVFGPHRLLPKSCHSSCYEHGAIDPGSVMTTDRRSLMQISLAGAALATFPATASASQSAEPVHDFDFLFGSWRVRHHYLKARLAQSTEWLEFGGTLVAQPTLGGAGNIDDNVVEKPTGTYRAMTIRTFDPKAGTWSIWYLDSRFPGTLDVPVVGRFENGVGTFVCDDTLNGKPIKVRFIWSDVTPSTARWAQAFSPDGGATWETNWKMELTRTAPYRPAS